MSHTPWYAVKGHDGGPKKSEPILSSVQRVLDVQRLSQQRRQVDDYCAAWMYQRDQILAQYSSAYESFASAPDGVSDRFGWIDQDFQIQSPSIVKSAVRTLVAWLFAETPPLGIKASGAKFEQKRAIDTYGCALDGLVNSDTNADRLRVAARDGVLKGFGAAWVQYIDGEIEIRRLHRHQVQFDPYDAREGQPRCIYVSEYRDRAAVMDWLKGFTGVKHLDAKLKKLKDLPSERPSQTNGKDWWTLYDWELNEISIPETTDRVRLLHCWRASTREGEDNGRYTVIAMPGDNAREGVVLLDQEYSRRTFPVVWWVADPNDEGIEGAGLYHDLCRWQSAIDRTMYKIQKTQDKYGFTKIYYREGSVDPAGLTAFANAGIFPIAIKSGEVPPQAIKGISLSAEDIQWVDKLMSMATSMVGINQAMAVGSSRLGAGASAVAMVEENFRSTDRFADVLRRWRRFLVELGRQTLYVLDAVMEIDPTYEAQFTDGHGDQRKIKWSDLREQNGSTVVDVQLRGELSGTRAGAASVIMDMAQRGVLDQHVAREMMLQTPDVRQAARMSLAGTRLVEWQLDNVVQDRKLNDSTPTQDMDTGTLEIAVDYSTKLIYLAIVEEATDKTISRLRAFKNAAEVLLRDRTPPPPAPGPPGGMPGGAGPQPGTPGP